MARKYTREQLADLAAFVKWLIERSPYPHDADLARAAAFPATNLSNVKNAKAGIDGYNLLRLIRASGVLEPAASSELPEQAAHPTSVPLEERVAALVDEVNRLVELTTQLALQVAQLERRATMRSA